MPRNPQRATGEAGGERRRRGRTAARNLSKNGASVAAGIGAASAKAKPAVPGVAGPRRDSVDVLVAEWRRERPDLDPWPVGILGRLHRISARLQRQVEVWLAPLDLTWESFSLILTLRRSGPPFALRPTDLYRESLLTSGAITNRIDRVEQQGLVRRRPDPNDGRVIVVELTAAGRRLADRAAGVHFRGLAEIFSGLPRDDRDALNASLSKLLAILEAD